MEMPNVVTEAIDETKNVRYEVVAYRKLTPNELVFAIRHALARMKRKPKKNSVCRLVAIIGHDEP